MKNLLFLLLLPAFAISQTKTAMKAEPSFAKNDKVVESEKPVATQPNNYSLTTQQITIEGTSNLHNWHQKVEKVSGKAIVNRGLDKSLSVQTLVINIDVNSIKGDGATMDNKAYKAMKADQFPNITFVITDPVANIPYGIKAFSTTATGQLTIAGRTKMITIPIRITAGDDRKILVSGSPQIKMTDYGVDPPTAMFGMLKTGDVVTIKFETTFSFSK